MDTRQTSTRPAARRALLGRLASLAIAAFVLMGAVRAPVAAINHPGTAIAGIATCTSTYVGVKFPLIQPAWVQYGSAGLFGTPSQKVAWRANLDQWDGTRWVWIREGLWIVGTADTSHDYGVYGSPWTLLDGRPVPQTLGFDRLPLRADGRPVWFKVWYEYRWYQDQYRDAGSAWAWAAGHREDRGGGTFPSPLVDQSSYAWCKYPGPNYLL